ncbi:Aep3p [Nakaseomyces bracarensis]|uniref:Aep3p n=1 Tax=Nakaseomyces bracarensis TaxID=273131 RepID=UPI0038725A4E
MNVIKRLGNAVSKNGDRVSRNTNALKNITAGLFERQHEVNKRSKELDTNLVPKIKDKNRYVRQNLHLVGKNSCFERKHVKQFLEPLEGYKLKRQQINTDYNTGLLRGVEKSGTQLNLSRSLMVKILPLLISCTPKESGGYSTLEVMKRKFPRYYTKEIPPIPDFNGDSKEFENYIALLTHTEFFHLNSSKSNGLVPKILRVLMHPGNLNTIELRTSQCYNDMIYFFSKKYDFATCREILAQMKVEGCQPNTSTYNLLLMNMVKNLNMKKVKPIDNELLFYLKDMKKNTIEADLVTWNICYNFMQDNLSKDLYLEKMFEYGVPLTADLIHIIVKNSLEPGIKSTISSILDILGTNADRLINLKFVNYLIKSLLFQNEIDVAWKVFKYFELKQMDLGSKSNFLINVDTLNIFLRKFAEQGRLDLSLLTYHYCTKKLLGVHKIRPDRNTFEMLLKCIIRNGYTKNLPGLAEYVYLLSNRYGIKIKNNNYWSVKIQSIIKFQYREFQFKERIKNDFQRLDNFSWGSDELKEFTLKVWKQGSKNTRWVCRFIGCMPTTVPSCSKPVVIYDHDESLQIKKAQYRRRVKSIAVMNAMASRVPYAKDWHGSFKKEVMKRKVLISETE